MTQHSSAKKYVLTGLVLLTLALALPAGLLAQASATNTASVEVQERAITLAALDPLTFGTVLAFGRSGFITISTTGQTSASNALSTAPGAPANYQVTGVPTAPFGVTLPANDSVTVSNGTNSMTVDNFNRTGNTSQLFLDGAGEAFFSVGARLNVNSRQPGGTYTGTFTVSVDYN